MIKVSVFKTVRARLLGLMALIVIPIATISILLASANYRSVLKGIEDAQLRTTSDFAVRTRVWFRGYLRTLVATVGSVQVVRMQPSGSFSPQGANEGCNAISAEVLRRVEGLQALRIKLEDGTQCHATTVAAITADVMDAISEQQKTRRSVQSWAGSNIAEMRYDAMRIEGNFRLMISARSINPAEPKWEATLLADPHLLDLTFDLGELENKTIIALLNRANEVVVSRGVDEADSSWLPTTTTFGEKATRFEAISQSGKDYLYGSHHVAEPDLYVLARFDDTTLKAAWQQFMVLCITPLLMLALLFATYAQVIQKNVVLWIAGIEQAARSRLEEPGANRLAPVDPSMPQDIRSVAVAFNHLVDDANQRELVLTQAVETNRFLMRELHHRVKNSLQVIQSYLALSRRQLSGSKSIDLAETEAKVQVLSTAYRQALTDGGMKAVLIKEFAEEIISNMSLSMRSPKQWISADITTDASLVVDRIIPLGLMIVEASIAGLRAAGATDVVLKIAAQGNGEIEMSVTTNGEVANGAPSPKIMAGLGAQLEALMQPAEAGTVLRLRFGA